jgi:hypothetical protein
VLLDSLDDVLLTFPLTGLSLVDVGLLVAPGLLVGKSFLAVLLLKGVDFKELFSSFDGFLVLRDGGLELLLSVNKSGVLVGQVSREFHPVVSLSLFRLLKNVSGFDKLLSELTQQLGDLLDGFGVDVGGQFSQGCNDGLEQGLVGCVFLKLLLDGIVAGLNLCESGSHAQMVDELYSIIHSVKSVSVLAIFAFPN